MPTEYRDPASDNSDAGSGNSSAETTIDPASIGIAAEPAEPVRKRRGRPPGSNSGTASKRAGSQKAQKVALDLSAITGMFVGLHALLAERTETPELAITMDEGQAFMKAAQNVMRHYSVETTQKTLDIVALLGVSAQIYMPRIAAISINKRVKQEREQARSNVAHINTPFVVPNNDQAF